MTRVVVFVEGGVVQEVIADNPCKVIILDADVEEGAFDPKRMAMYVGHQQYLTIVDALQSGSPQRVRYVRSTLHDQGISNA
jgi:hypothetical protein